MKTPKDSSILKSINLGAKLTETIETIGDTPEGQDLIWVAISRAIVHKKNGNCVDLLKSCLAGDNCGEQNDYTGFESNANLYLDDLYPKAVKLVQERLNLPKDSYCDLGVDWATNREKEQSHLEKKVKNSLSIKKQVLLDAGKKGYPVLVQDVFDADQIENFIRERAKRDLPRCQFRGEMPLLVWAYIEAVGVITYSNNTRQIKEISYLLSEPEDVSVRLDNNIVVGMTVSPPSFRFKIDEDILNSNKLILWHNHPDLSVPSGDDINTLFEHHNTFSDLEVYLVNYYPAIDNFLWLKIKEEK